jgi:hypothetical protein
MMLCLHGQPEVERAMVLKMARIRFCMVLLTMVRFLQGQPHRLRIEENAGRRMCTCRDSGKDEIAYCDSLGQKWRSVSEDAPLEN